MRERVCECVCEWAVDAFYVTHSQCYTHFSSFQSSHISSNAKLQILAIFMNYSTFYIIHFECADTFNTKTMTKETRVLYFFLFFFCFCSLFRLQSLVYSLHITCTSIHSMSVNVYIKYSKRKVFYLFAE